jgi:Kef-type K+ transport system membrane component KefB
MFRRSIIVIYIFVLCLFSWAGAQDAWSLPESKQTVANEISRQSTSGEHTRVGEGDVDKSIQQNDMNIAGEGIGTGDEGVQGIYGGEGNVGELTQGDDGSQQTIAKLIDDKLKEEFKDDAGEDGKQYNETVLKDESKQETVVRISQSNTNKKEDTSQDGDESHGDRSSDGVESEVDRIIDSHDNEYVLSKPNIEGSLGLTLDPQLIRDMSLLIITSALAGQLMAALGQPTINGYFLAGSLLGQGGFGLAKEIVQLQSVSQLGVQFLLFTLGLELNLSKLKAVRNVALFGGILEVGLMAVMGAVVAFLIGAGGYHGAFVGALLAMSSTSIVVKCIQEARVSHQPHAQITFGTLVLQDCVVGLIFAFMPVLSMASSTDTEAFSVGEIFLIIGKVFGTLSIAIAAAVLFSLLLAPGFVSCIKKSSTETFQLSILGFALLVALITTKLGISAELGAFMAGASLSATEDQQMILNAIEPTANLFLALFVCSTGLTIPPAFLIEHFMVLASGVALIIAGKSFLIASVVLLFGFPSHTAARVGINLAQVGEFGFVLLSIASRYGMIPHEVSLLLIGITALSLLLTPFLLQISLKVVPKVAKSSRYDDQERAPLVTSSTRPGHFE